MKNLTETFRGSLPQNTRRKSSSHPDFISKLSIWSTTYSAAAWLSKTVKGAPYLGLHLTSDETTQSERIKLALWSNHDRKSAADPHFQSTQEIFRREFLLQGWLLSMDGSYRLELSIQPANHGGEVSDAFTDTSERITDFLAGTVCSQLEQPKLSSQSPASMEEPDSGDIPF